MFNQNLLDQQHADSETWFSPTQGTIIRTILGNGDIIMQKTVSHNGFMQSVRVYEMPEDAQLKKQWFNYEIGSLSEVNIESRFAYQKALFNRVVRKAKRILK